MAWLTELPFPPEAPTRNGAGAIAGWTRQFWMNCPRDHAGRWSAVRALSAVPFQVIENGLPEEVADEFVAESVPWIDLSKSGYSPKA
jgi:hypothetical protein